jgi:hypothetical protein
MRELSEMRALTELEIEAVSGGETAKVGVGGCRKDNVVKDVVDTLAATAVVVIGTLTGIF